MPDDQPAEPVTTDRTGIEVLSFDECRQLLADNEVGRVAFMAAGDIDIFPVNYAVMGHVIVIRTAQGEKLSAAIMQQAVSFEIDGVDPDTRSGWSVLVKGTGRLVDDDDLERMRSTGLAPWAGTEDRDEWIQIVPHELTGRRVGI